MVDARNHLTGTVFTPSDIFAPITIDFDARQPGFSSPFRGRYEAHLLDIRGRVVGIKTGQGAAAHAFDLRGLQAGVYFLCVKAGSGRIQVKRYLL